MRLVQGNIDVDQTLASPGPSLSGSVACGASARRTRNLARRLTEKGATRLPFPFQCRVRRSANDGEELLLAAGVRAVAVAVVAGGLWDAAAVAEAGDVDGARAVVFVPIH
jgi:hypothetical protein